MSFKISAEEGAIGKIVIPCYFFDRLIGVAKQQFKLHHCIMVDNDFRRVISDSMSDSIEMLRGDVEQ